MSTQVPSVLIRVPGTARDRILALRRKRKTPWGFSSQEETIGEVVERITAAAMPKPAAEEPKKAKKRPRPRARHVVNKRGRRGKGKR